MEQGYAVRPIGAETVDQAYPLVALARPDLDLEGWRRLCGASGGSDGSVVLIVAGPRGYVHGLCILKPTLGRMAERAAEVPVLVIGSAVDPAGVAAALLRALVAACRASHCTALRISIPRNDATTVAALQNARSATSAHLVLRRLEIDVR